MSPNVMLNDLGSAEMPPLTDILSMPDVSTDIAEYLSHLTSLPLPELQAEPTAVSSSSAQLTNALTTLCHTSYPTFLALHSTTSTLSSSLSSLSASLDALISTLPSLEAEAKKFVQETRETQKERNKASLVLEHHDKLQDVLSLPQLMDYCVRNHSYSEALLLSNHANGLSTRFPNNALVQSVKAECDARVQAMLGQLLRMLNEQAKLPALFRAVSFLRKMGVFDEEELGLAFLAGRGVYLDSVLKTVEVEKGIEGDKERDREAYARYLKKYVDVWREGVYDVITQYTTIFLDRAPSSSASASTPGPPPSRQHALLATFATYRMESFLALLRETLAMIPDPVLLTPLLTQLTYCANSFARVGMDFRPFLAPIFVHSVKQAMTKEFKKAATDWGKRLKADEPASRRDASAQRTAKKPSQIFIAPDVSHTAPPIPTPKQLETVSSGPPNVPPPILLSYPPIAIYTNAILTALNGLRMLAPLELVDDLLESLDDTLAEGLSVLLELAQDRALSGTEEERKEEAGIVKVAGIVCTRVFVPFVRRALVEGVYSVAMGDVEGMSQSLEGALRDWEAWLDGSKDVEQALLNGE